MLKILNKIEFSKEENKMKSIGNVETAIKLFKERFTNHDFIKINSPYEEKRK